MKAVFWRGQIVFNRRTLEVGSVQTDPLGGLYRPQFEVKVNTFGGEKPYRIEWRAEHCLPLGYQWAGAWLELRRMRDVEGWPLTDPRLGLPEVETIEVTEVA